MQIIEVKDKGATKAFHQVPHDIYRDDQNWVPPIKALEDATFDPAKNEFFQHGEGTRWILIDNHQKAIGRIGAFINRNKAFSFKTANWWLWFF